MKKIQWLMGFVFAISLLVIFLITSFEIAMYADFSFYQKEYEKYDVLDDLDMTMEDTMYVTREMMAYLRGNRDALSVVTTVEGREQDFFNEQDRFHMGEVQGLFLGGLSLRLGAIAAAAASLVILLVSKMTRFRESTLPDVSHVLSKSYRITLGILAVLLTVLGLAVARDFNAVFTLFHEIFFDNDLWLFDPAEDYMIRMLPEGLFFDFVLRIGLFFVAGLAVMLAVFLVLEWRERRARGILSGRFHRS